MLRVAIMFLSLAGPVAVARGGEGAPAVGVPTDGRLASVRAELQARLNRVAEAGLPTELLLNKIREGLAKNVAPQRIAATTLSLADHLEAAYAFLSPRCAGDVSAGLLRVVTEARMSGIALADLEALVSGPDLVADRAVQVVVDLKWRGYPAERTARLVGEVVRRDPANLDRLPGMLESIRREQSLAPGDCIEALVNGLGASASLSGAYARVTEAERRKGSAQGGRKADEPALRRGNGTRAVGLPAAPLGQLKN